MHAHKFFTGSRALAVAAALTLLALLFGPLKTSAYPFAVPQGELLASGLSGASGGSFGPDGALYVTEGALGRVIRVDPWTGAKSVYAEGFPPSLIGIGGAYDLAFVDGEMYVLVTLVGSDVGGTDAVGIYRPTGQGEAEPVADIGQFARDNPPSGFDFVLPTGVQYALHPFRGNLLVTDGHHNRLLLVSLEGEVSEMASFGNIVPTGLEVRGSSIYMAQAGPVPHLPETGKVVRLQPWGNPRVGYRVKWETEVAAGARLAVDVELGRGHQLYVLSQGEFPEGAPDGSPALPNDSGALLQVNLDGTMTPVIEGLNQPTTVMIRGNTAYIVNLSGEIWRYRIPRWPHHRIGPIWPRGKGKD